MEVKTESTGSEISPEDEKPRIKEEENLSQEEPDFYDYPPLEPFDHLDQDMVEEEDDSKDLDFKFEKPKAKKTAKKPRKTAVRKPRDPNAPPKPKKSQKGVYKKPEVPKYDPEFFLCDEALWDKMVANVEPLCTAMRIVTRTLVSPKNLRMANASWVSCDELCTD